VPLHHSGLLYALTDLQFYDAQLLDQAYLAHRHVREVGKPNTSDEVTLDVSVLLVQNQVEGNNLKAVAMGKL